MKSQKKFVVVVFMVVFITTVLSVSSMVKDARSNSFETFAQGTECRAQGIFMPEPFEETLVAPVEDGRNLICTQGDIKPNGFEKDPVVDSNSGS
ncbi:MAG: hypothetical protein APR54_06565 [Candidatus Cloacimonas sp. SDB]|nr:MAG: hypothetical protein APR54_06565 [Candidatus Cloacimonas sp. SDB]